VSRCSKEPHEWSCRSLPKSINNFGQRILVQSCKVPALDHPALGPGGGTSRYFGNPRCSCYNIPYL
jgi:hypothetical protein